MSTQVSAIPARIQNPNSNIVNRCIVDYRPSIWGDHFLSFEHDSMETIDNLEQQVQRFKEQVRRALLMASVDEKPSEKLDLIDAIQRLGVSYHFESEINEILQKINENDLQNDDDDLYIVALRFRLLRQQGYNVPSNVFNKFKDRMGNFKESLISDVQGMLSLYEAAYMMVHGEDILDEALAFTTTQLESMVTYLSPPLNAQVSHALKRPLRKGMPRLEARHYCVIYQEISSRNEVLLTLAKLDFNLLQKRHQRELSHISRWWKNLDFATTLSFARDRVVELYFWISGVYFEPQYSLARRMLTKVTTMVSVIDDIYDVYGTLEELEQFTKAIQRWDVDCLDQLPEYMKVCYRALLDVYEEIEKEMSREGRLYRVHYAKDAMKKLVQAYFVEAKWSNEKYIPTMEEYMHIARQSCAYPMLTTTSFVGMGDIVTKEAFDWVLGNPEIVIATSTICRLMDDIVSNEFEQNREHVASCVQCYMKEHGVSKEEAHDEFRRQIENAWKDINQECLRPTEVPLPLLMRLLNLARVMDVIYKDEDAYTNLGKVLRDGVTLLFVDPVSE